MEDDKYIVEWSANDVPEWPRINHALADLGFARIIPVRTDDDAAWQAVVVASPQTTYREAQSYYDEHRYDDVRNDN